MSLLMGGKNVKMERKVVNNTQSVAHGERA